MTFLATQTARRTIQLRIQALQEQVTSHQLTTAEADELTRLLAVCSASPEPNPVETQSTLTGRQLNLFDSL